MIDDGAVHLKVHSSSTHVLQILCSQPQFPGGVSPGAVLSMHCALSFDWLDCQSVLRYLLNRVAKSFFFSSFEGNGISRNSQPLSWYHCLVKEYRDNFRYLANVNDVLDMLDYHDKCVPLSYLRHTMNALRTLWHFIATWKSNYSSPCHKLTKLIFFLKKMIIHISTQFILLHEYISQYYVKRLQNFPNLNEKITNL